MNKEIKEKLLEALRSGEYKQGYKTLHRVKENESAFCCLGVLTDIFIKENCLNCFWKANSYYPETLGFSYEENGFIPPTENYFLVAKVANWSGISYPISKILMEKNDILKESFEEIADYIEKNL